MKLAPDGHTCDGQVGEGGADPLALGHDGLDPGLHLVGEAQGQAAGDLLGRVEVVRQHDLVELGHEPRRPDEVAEPAAAIDHVLEYVRVTTSGRSSSTRSSADHGANWP